MHVNRGAGEAGCMPLVGFKVNGKRPCKKGVVTQPQPSLRTLDSLSPCWYAPCLSVPTVTPCWDREQKSYSGAMLCRTPRLWKEFPESQNPPPSMGKDIMGSLCTRGVRPSSSSTGVSTLYSVETLSAWCQSQQLRWPFLPPSSGNDVSQKIVNPKKHPVERKDCLS